MHAGNFFCKTTTRENLLPAPSFRVKLQFPYIEGWPVNYVQCQQSVAFNQKLTRRCSLCQRCEVRWESIEEEREVHLCTVVVYTVMGFKRIFFETSHRLLSCCPRRQEPLQPVGVDLPCAASLRTLSRCAWTSWHGQGCNNNGRVPE